jgi:hypothetical protein
MFDLEKTGRHAKEMARYIGRLSSAKKKRGIIGVCRCLGSPLRLYFGRKPKGHGQRQPGAGVF